MKGIRYLYITMKYLQSSLYNTLFTILVSTIAFILYHQSGALENAGMAAMLLNWLPIAIGLVTIMGYFFAKVCKASWSWKISILGAFFNILLVISAYFG